MKNKSFFYLQYDKINWQNQDKTKINSYVNNYILKEIVSKKKPSDSVKLFDMGFGIGFFMKMAYNHLNKLYKEITLEGCEPSYKNYDYFIKKPINTKKNLKLKVYKETFQDVQTENKFDFITSIYVFPHFVFDDLEKVAQKIYSMLEEKGKFILVVAEENYLEEKLRDKRDIFIENNVIDWNEKRYQEWLHYSDIPKIGKVIDYNREAEFYIDLFKKNNLELVQKKNLNDNGFICTVFVFEKI